ncbi:hypothetical protein RCL1_004933 [Eukaryota sp. TZLM3-RCL]
MFRFLSEIVTSVGEIIAPPTSSLRDFEIHVQNATKSLFLAIENQTPEQEFLKSTIPSTFAAIVEMLSDDLFPHEPSSPSPLMLKILETKFIESLISIICSTTREIPSSIHINQICLKTLSIIFELDFNFLHHHVIISALNGLLYFLQSNFSNHFYNHTSLVPMVKILCSKFILDYSISNSLSCFNTNGEVVDIPLARLVFLMERNGVVTQLFSTLFQSKMIGSREFLIELVQLEEIIGQFYSELFSESQLISDFSVLICSLYRIERKLITSLLPNLFVKISEDLKKMIDQSEFNLLFLNNLMVFLNSFESVDLLQFSINQILIQSKVLDHFLKNWNETVAKTFYIFSCFLLNFSCEILGILTSCYDLQSKSLEKSTHVLKFIVYCVPFNSLLNSKKLPIPVLETIELVKKKINFMSKIGYKSKTFNFSDQNLIMEFFNFSIKIFEISMENLSTNHQLLVLSSQNLTNILAISLFATNYSNFETQIQQIVAKISKFLIPKILDVPENQILIDEHRNIEFWTKTLDENIIIIQKYIIFESFTIQIEAVSTFSQDFEKFK